MAVEFGGKRSRCFEYLRMRPAEDVEDGKITVVGPELTTAPEGGALPLAILVEVSGRKMQKDFEPILERQIHYFINGAEGIQHIGQRDITWIRVSKSDVQKGFRLEHFGKILHARMHGMFGSIVDKVQVTLFTDEHKVNELLEVARAAYQERNQRIASLTDESVDTFYSCTLCQSFAPTHVCVINPERVGLCGAYNWLDCRAAFEINPTGPNQPIPKGVCIDAVKGEFSGPNEFVYSHSNQSVQRVTIYSLMDAPMTSCFVGDTEVLIDGEPRRLGGFVEEHRGGEAYTHSMALTMNTGTAVEERIVAMQRFPAPERLVRIITKSGLEVIATPDHEVAVDRFRKTEVLHGGTWVRAHEIQVGDRVFALKQFVLDASRPEMVDLLPDDFRLADAALVAEVKERLQAKHGSLAAVWRDLGVKPLDPRVNSLPLGLFKRALADLGETWDGAKGSVKTVLCNVTHLDLPPLNEDLFYLLGLLSADGSFQRQGRHQCTINFVNTSPELLAAFTETYQHLFPGQPIGMVRHDSTAPTLGGRTIQATRPCYRLYLNNPLLGVLAESFGVKMDGAEHWNLGRMVRLPEGLIAAFLAGNFDGDGSARVRQSDGRWETGEVYLCVADRRAAGHLQLLLKRLGIVGHVRPDRSVYKVELYGSQASRFATFIHARHPEKAETLRHIAALAEREGTDKAQAQVLPFAVGQAVAAITKGQDVLAPSTRYYYETGRSRPTVDNVLKAIKGVPEAAFLEEAAHADYFLDPVVVVEEVRNQGQHDYDYNLTLENIHAYYANQLLVKNCGCFECIMVLVPEANGVMIVSREDPSMTPCGMTFSTLAGTAGGGLQNPGMMGHGKYYLTSKKFLLAEGGFKRVVWMSSVLKETMADDLKVVCEAEGDPDLLSKIADERDATTVEELLPFLEAKGHPALTMDPMF